MQTELLADPNLSLPDQVVKKGWAGLARHPYASKILSSNISTSIILLVLILLLLDMKHPDPSIFEMTGQRNLEAVV